MTFALMSFLADQTGSMDFFPESASTFASSNDGLFFFISIICVIFFIGIAVPLFWFSWKYSKPKGAPAESQADHNTTIELVWSVGPSFLLIVMFYFGAVGYLNHRSIPEGAYEVGVKAYKWGWTMNYGNGVFHPELHIVVDEPTKLSMTSDDVIHSLYVPAFRAKKDIVPGRYNYMWFMATKASERDERATDEELERLNKKYMETGESWPYDEHQFTPDGYKFFDLYCTEYCGRNHSEMQTVVVVHESRADLEAWIEKYSKRQPGVPPVAHGQKLYEQRGCKGCHSLDGSRLVGPSYKDSFGTTRQLVSGESVPVDENYIRESILLPKEKVAAGYQPVMPSYKGQLSEDDIYCLVEFIKSYGSAPAAGQATEGDSAGEAEQEAAE